MANATRDFRRETSSPPRVLEKQQRQVRLNFKVFNDIDNGAKALNKKQETNFVGGKTWKWR